MALKNCSHYATTPLMVADANNNPFLDAPTQSELPRTTVHFSDGLPSSPSSIIYQCPSAVANSVQIPPQAGPHSPSPYSHPLHHQENSECPCAGRLLEKRCQSAQDVWKFYDWITNGTCTCKFCRYVLLYLVHLLVTNGLIGSNINVIQRMRKHQDLMVQIAQQAHCGNISIISI